MRIEKEYKKVGYFWLPENKENKISGILSIYNGGIIELEIIDFFDENRKYIDEDNIPRRIIGHVEEIGLVTLDKCLYNGDHYYGGILKVKYIVDMVLCGKEWGKEESVTFNTFSFSVDCLDEWVGISGIRRDLGVDNITANISYNPPEEISMALDNGMNIKICFAYTLPGLPCLIEAKITQRVYFQLKSEELRDISVFISIAYKITKFMSFAMDEVVYIKNVLANYNNKTFHVPISIYYESFPFHEKIPKKTKHKMLLIFSELTNAQQSFNRWLHAYEDLEPVFFLYFSVKYGDQKYPEGTFLALVQGIESYHRRTSSDTKMDVERFNSMYSKIIEKCPDEHRAWLEKKLEFANEMSLSMRIKDIIKPFKEYFGSAKKREKLINKIVETRNHLTHYDKNSQNKSAKDKDLIYLCWKLDSILKLIFLTVIGLTHKEIKEVVENQHYLIFFLSILYMVERPILSWRAI
jgi:ApeA N-terminal domain 1